MTVVGKPRDADPRDVADAERTALRVEFDRRGTDGDDVTRFPHPRQLHDVRAAALAEQDLREPLALFVAAALVHVQDDRPRRPGLVVVACATRQSTAVPPMLPLSPFHSV